MRWVIVVAFAIPLLFLLVLLVAKFGANEDFARKVARALVWIVWAEILFVMALALVGVVYEQRARSHDRQLYRPPGRLVDIGGYRLHINCVGSGGPTVVLEYGREGSYFDWYRIQPEIAQFARVCYYDRAGYGWSDPSPRPRITSVMAEELHSLLYAAGEKPPFILAAHSFASFNALMFAHKFPDETAGLVLIDGLHTFPPWAFPFSDRLSLRGMQLMLPFGLPRWRGWCGTAGPPELRGEKQAVMCQPSLYGAFYDERAAVPQDVQQVRAITSLGSVPIIVIARDPDITNTNPEFWHAVQEQKIRLSTHSELVVATGSGHNVPNDRPDVIIVAVKKLVSQTPGTGGHPGNSVK